MWSKPNEFYGIMRCTNVKYAGQLIKRGSIKFNTPQAWVEDGIKNGDGRGDLLEGTFAACSKSDVELIKSYMEKYDDVYKETIGEVTYFRRERTMNLPCYCFFLLKLDLFECPEKEGRQRIKGEISGKYFKDFASDLSKEENEQLQDYEKPSFVFIQDMDMFIKMICKELKRLGLDDNEIMIENIEYCDKSTEHYCKADSPKELKLKPNRFSYQSEGRIIVNTDKSSILEYLYKNPIEIGSIDNISERVDGYFPEGMLVSMKATVYEVTEN